MNKIYYTVTVGLFYFISFTACAQQKYALLVGINKYYKDPGVLYHSELRGCVNDAFAMGGLLLQRYGFDKKNISILSDEQASSENVLAAFMEILHKVKSGDVFVFYFSGHGVWMKNGAQSKYDAQVKNGMNQAMVMSNLYAPGMRCLIRDNELKMICNKFIDKKVIVTNIIDCCFSGKLMMGTQTGLEDSMQYDHIPEAGGFQKAMDLDDIEEISPFDADLNYQPDEGKAFYYKERSMNLKDAIIIRDSLSVTRPSERPNSMYLGFGASSDLQPGLEIMDETGLYHGAYTKALLQTIKRHPADYPSKKLMEEIMQVLKKQHYTQSPMLYADPQRMDKNLFGIGSKDLRDVVLAKAVSISGTTVQLDEGLYAGLSRGNLLSKKSQNNKLILQVATIDNNQSSAKVIKGEPAWIKPGDAFSLTDGYILSAPVIKIYLPHVNIAPATYDSFFNKEILPLTKLNNYWSYGYWKPNKPYRNIFLNDQVNYNSTIQKFLSINLADNFFAFLPIPDYIANTLRDELRRNQNLEMVTSETEADYTLYLTYVPASAKRPASFVFTWNNFTRSEMTGVVFFDLHADLPNMHPANKALTDLASDISKMATDMIRSRSSRWLNDYPLR